MAEILRTERLTKEFGELVANDHIDFSMEENTIQCIIGPNGAGKTTFLSLISGHNSPSAGRIWYRDDEVTSSSIIERARRGIGRKFQTPSVFNELTAYENIEIAVLGARRDEGRATAEIRRILETVGLSEHPDIPVKSLSHGQRQRLELGLLLGVQSELLLLDEPTAGLTVEETATIANLVKRLKEELAISVIVIEHDMRFIEDLDAPVTVFHLGSVLARGSFEDVSGNQRVRDVYLSG